MDQRIQQAFDSIHAEESLRASTKEYLAQKVYRKGATHRIPYMRYAVALICMLVAGSGYFAYFTPVSAISVDTDSSVELKVNLFNRVIEVSALDPAGETLVDSVSVMYCKYMDAVQQLVEAGEDETPAIVTVSADSEERNTQMMAAIEENQEQGAPIICMSVSSEMATAADESGLSMGKYRLYLEWNALDASITPEYLQGMSMREIREAIDALEAEPNESLSPVVDGNSSGAGKNSSGSNGWNSEKGNGHKGNGNSGQYGKNGADS